MILLSSLGKANYSETEYFLGDDPGKRLRTRFAPVATARLTGVQQARFFVTDEARKWENDVRAELEPHGVKTEFVTIPPGRAEEEIEQIVATIFEAVPDEARWSPTSRSPCVTCRCLCSRRLSSSPFARGCRCRAFTTGRMKSPPPAPRRSSTSLRPSR